MCPKDKLFKGYIELETRLHEFARCRTLYEKHIEFSPTNAQTWIRFAELEMALEDDERVRAIFELAVEQEMLDMPELLWKSYIDFEEESGEFDRTRELFERLLQKTDHVKVWISYAHFEINADEGVEEEDETVSEEAKSRARAVFERSYKSLKAKDLKEEVCYNSTVLLPIPERATIWLVRALTLICNTESCPSKCLEILREYPRLRGRHQKGRSADASQGQEEEKVGRRQLRGVYGLYLPSGRAGKCGDAQIVGGCTQMEAIDGAGVKFVFGWVFVKRVWKIVLLIVSRG